jgi:hypothetical protein
MFYLGGSKFDNVITGGVVLYQGQFTPPNVVDTAKKFTAGVAAFNVNLSKNVVVYTGGKFAAGVSGTGGQFSIVDRCFIS